MGQNSKDLRARARLVSLAFGSTRVRAISSFALVLGTTVVQSLPNE